jgi:hypothetical protein
MNNETKVLTMISLATALLLIALMVSSCATNGYGCRGKSKIMTRVRQ